MAEVKFCKNNFPKHETDRTMDRLKENFSDDEVEISEVHCLGFCGNCEDGPMAMVDGDIIRAYTAEELYERIEDKL